jgi:hypothetical protein
MEHYLIVANQTAAGPALKRAVKEHMRQGPCTFTLVVPATHPRDHATWTEGIARELAKQRMCDALESLRVANAKITGWVGDEDPYLAVSDALRAGRYDGVILSTFQKSASRWARMDVASRIARDFGIRVEIVEAERIDVRTGA